MSVNGSEVALDTQEAAARRGKTHELWRRLKNDKREHICKTGLPRGMHT